MARFATVGHSSRNPEQFLDMLRAAGTAMLADVRRFAHSRSNPAFGIDKLPQALARAQIGYCHLPLLGGRRSKQPGVDPDLNGYWRVTAFHNYADYALGPEFAAGFDKLLALGHRQPVVVMCAEAVWWRCHRRIIADYLLLHGHAVDHLMAPGQTMSAHPTPGAVLTAEGKVNYPAPGPGCARQSR